MWIFTRTGFISAVRKSGETALTIRSRDKKSLKSLAEATGANIDKTPFADYPYRLTCSVDSFINWISNQAGSIDYSNFKTEVAGRRGSRFANALNEVWSVMHEVEDNNARSYAQLTESLEEIGYE